ncbi:Hypothetical Protein FCC1311_116712 [Hondaea fermentalgiana]|uniref:Uncharacterized protein n=1 Tax=Hondaea fermentalgiana TaxID=2315210 RepID=A0A2R5FD75_9STRA|nr:Hypothetical Protein FCC1311_116712 [Hondaea fermentalgiana]|eukprot:GBG16196.1 Hypothetical Protein FCC1311_116712 [Hondaea fermentalgiana]
MEAKFANEIQLLTVTNPSKTPKQIMKTFLDQHVGPKPASYFPTETQIKAKIVNVKTKYRKMQAKPTNNDI